MPNPESQTPKEWDGNTAETGAAHEEWRHSLPSHHLTMRRDHSILGKGAMEVASGTASTHIACQFIALYEQALQRRRRPDWPIVRGPNLAPVPKEHQKARETVEYASVDVELKNVASIIYTTLWVRPSGQQVDWKYVRRVKRRCIAFVASMLALTVLCYLVAGFGLFGGSPIIDRYYAHYRGPEERIIVRPRTALGFAEPSASSPPNVVHIAPHLNLELLPLYGMLPLFVGGIVWFLAGYAEDKLHHQVDSFNASLLGCVEEALAILEGHRERTVVPVDAPIPAADQQNENGQRVKRRWQPCSERSASVSTDGNVHGEQSRIPNS